MGLQNLPRGNRYLHALVEGHEIDDDCYVLLKSTDSLKPNNEFRQWLHIWNMSTANSRDAAHVDIHTSVPWVRLWDKPDLSLLAATYHVTDFVHFPTSWSQIWYHLEEMIEDRRGDPTAFELPPPKSGIHGPYWTLMEKPTIAFLAGYMAEMKRKIAAEVFKEYDKSTYELDSLTPERRSALVLEATRIKFFSALEPFRVLSPQQEREDEAARIAEERGNAVRVRNRVALGRPPRCR